MSIATQLMTCLVADAIGEVNVKSYGAQGDGTTDDTAAFQAAHDALAMGGTIRIPPGTYVIATSISVTNPSIRWVGSGRPSRNASQDAPTTIKHTGGGSTKCFDLPNSGSGAGCSWENLQINITNSGYGIFADNKPMCRLSNVRIQGGGLTGIGISLSDISSAGPSDQWVISDCIIDRCNIGLDINKSSDPKLSRCLIQSCTIGARLGNVSGQSVSGCSFHQCIIQRNSMADIDAVRVNNLNVVSCYLESQTSGSYSLRVGNNGGDFICRNVVLDGCYCNGRLIATYGVSLANVDNIELSNNLFFQYNTKAVNVGSGVTNLTMANNSPIIPVAQTGMVAVANGNAAVVGTLTVFTTALAIGSSVRFGTDTTAYKVATIADNIHLTLTSVYAGATTSGLAWDKITYDETKLLSSTMGLRHRLDSNGLTVATGVAADANASIKAHLSATDTWNPGTMVADGDTVATTITVTGAAVGDTAVASLTTIGNNVVLISAFVSAFDTVKVILLNKTGGGLDIASGTLRADVWKH